MTDMKIVIEKSGTGLDISELVKSVEITGDSTRFHRTCSISLISTTDGRTPAIKLEEGSSVRFIYANKTRFYGVLFAQELDSNGDMTITAHDTNAYLAKNTDSRIFTNKKASEIISSLTKDFDVPSGSIADTGYVIPYLRLANMTIYEMILKALTLTRKQTGKRFFIGCDDNGKLTLKSGVDGDRYLFQDGENLISASYSRSIEDTKTQVKVIGGKKGSETVVTVKDAAKRDKYGTLQAYEEMDESATASQVKQRADTLLKEQSVVAEQLQAEVLGVPEVDVGTAVYINNEMTGIACGYYVTSITHNYADVHTMSLELTKTYELPDTTINDDELKKE